jgi:integrase
LRPSRRSSGAGRRTLKIPEEVARVLEAHLREFCTPNPNSYVFTTDEGRPIERNNFRNRVWLPACERAGVAGFHFHDLRHHAATLAAASGVPIKALMQRLGHSSPHASLIYQHAAMEDEERIAAHIDARFTSMRSPRSI